MEERDGRGGRACQRAERFKARPSTSACRGRRSRSIQPLPHHLDRRPSCLDMAPFPAAAPRLASLDIRVASVTVT